MLRLLDAFTSEAPTRSTENLIKFSGSSRSTTYRYIRALQRCGLLSPVANGSWTLGSRILELDLQLRNCDPLYLAGGATMKRLVERTGHTALLCTLFSDAVICIRDERSAGAPSGLFSRGQRRPLFTAAASKIMLPYLPPHQLRRVYSNNKAAIAAAKLGRDWKEFRARLREMRNDGHCVTVGEFRPGVVGIAAPVIGRSGVAVASLGIAFPRTKLRAGQKDDFVAVVMEMAGRLSTRIRRSENEIDMSARGVGRVLEPPPTGRRAEVRRSR
jgi:DNA-binding IclR family transcriptional regulator